jgi:hypothetical protein
MARDVDSKGAGWGSCTRDADSKGARWSQCNAVVAGGLRTTQTASLLRQSKTKPIATRIKKLVRGKLGVHNLPNSYLHAPAPYGLGLYDLQREGARDVLLAVGTLNTCPADIWENIGQGYLDGMQHLGQCRRTTVPQDGEWYRRGTCENTLAGDVLDACRRLDTCVTWDCGTCNQKGPLLVQRGLCGGKGLVPRPDIPGQCTINHLRR